MERRAWGFTRLSDTEACGFDALFADVSTRAGLIVTFLALLEMIRLRLVRVYQQTNFGPIRVYRRQKAGAAGSGPAGSEDPALHKGPEGPDLKDPKDDDRRL